MHQSVDVSVASRDILPKVAELYREVGYRGGVSESDITLVAYASDQLVGAVRLCLEHSVMVLRGMQVRVPFQRQRIGSRLLQACPQYLNHSIAYCLPYEHLIAFYAAVGFEPTNELPAFLRERLSSYIASGMRIVGMCRLVHNYSVKWTAAAGPR